MSGENENNSEVSFSSGYTDDSDHSSSDAEVNCSPKYTWFYPVPLLQRPASVFQNNPVKRPATDTVAEAEQQSRRDTPYPHARVARFTDSSSGLDSSTLPSLGEASGCNPVVGGRHVTDSPFPVATDRVAERFDQSGHWWTPPQGDRTGYLWNAAPGTPVAGTKPKVCFTSTPEVRHIPPVWPESPLLRSAEQTPELQPTGKQRYAYYNSMDSGFNGSTASPGTGSSCNSSRNRTAYLDSLLSSASSNSSVSRCVFRPKKFRGKNWSGYKHHFIAVAQVNGWSQAEAARMLKACLSDSVALVLRKSLRKDNVPLGALFEALDERYDVPGPDYVLKGKVRRTLQRPDQSVDDYQTELVKVLSGRLDAEDSEVALEQFIYGLHDPKMQKHVGKRMPIDLHDALRIAREYEETSSWVANASRYNHKRIGMVTVAEADRPATQRNDTGPPPATSERSLVGDMDQLFKKIEALELHNQQFRKNRENSNGKSWKFNKWKKFNRPQESNDGKVADTGKGEDKGNAKPPAGNDGGKQQD